MKQDEITYTYGKIVNIFIVFEIVGVYSNINYPKLQNALLGAVKFTENADIDKYG